MPWDLAQAQSPWYDQQDEQWICLTNTENVNYSCSPSSTSSDVCTLNLQHGSRTVIALVTHRWSVWCFEENGPSLNRASETLKTRLLKEPVSEPTVSEGFRTDLKKRKKESDLGGNNPTCVRSRVESPHCVLGRTAKTWDFITVSDTMA